MTSSPAFCIVETTSIRCQIRDGIIGSTSKVVRYFDTEAYAYAVARRLEEGSGDDEVSYYVRLSSHPFESARRRSLLKVAAEDDAIPF